MLRYFIFFKLITCAFSEGPDQKALFESFYEVAEPREMHDSIYKLNFTIHGDATTPLDWFKMHGFVEKFASQINLGFRDDGIIFETRNKRTAVFVKQLNIVGATRIKVLWKVLKYPAGANWEEGNSYSAISVNVAFGTEKFPSGHFFLPAAPRFFSLFPGQSEPEGKFYQHKYYRESSRHICIASSIPAGEWINTEFELPQNFQNTFGIPMPSVSGFGIAIHTSGKSKALLKSIEFLQ